MAVNQAGAMALNHSREMMRRMEDGLALDSEAEVT